MKCNWISWGLNRDQGFATIIGVIQFRKMRATALSPLSVIADSRTFLDYFLMLYNNVMYYDLCKRSQNSVAYNIFCLVYN